MAATTQGEVIQPSGPEPSLQTAGLPFLPGNCFRDPTKTKYHVSQSLSYRNGYSMAKRAEVGIGGGTLPYSRLSEAELDEMAKMRPSLTYGQTKPPAPVTFVPAHVAFDKKVLMFRAFFKQTVHESPQEFYRVRPVKIYYYLEDDTISVTEPTFDDSGMPQGKLIKRQRLPKDDRGNYWDWRDFNIGKNVTFYGKVFHMYDSDAWTREYMASEGITLEEPEECPPDPYFLSRTKPLHQQQTHSDYDKLRQFLTLDKQVLRFYAIWDDSREMFGQKRQFIIHYYLVDDTMEVREVRQQNDGYDPFPLLIGRSKIPKDRRAINDSFPTIVLETSPLEISEYFSPTDLRVGETVWIMDRPFYLYDCDEFTRNYYRTKYGLHNMQRVGDVTALPPPQPEMSLPPYNGLGTLDDTRENCLHLIPNPPKKDVIKFLEEDGNVLRYAAVLESRHPQDEHRKFIITYHINDDTISIYEPPQRNSGVIGGKFLERSRIPKKGQPMVKTGIVDHPDYYTIGDLAIGTTVEFFKHRFIIKDAADYVLTYMEQIGIDQFPEDTVESLRDLRMKKEAASRHKS